MSKLQELSSITTQHHRPGERRLSEAQLEARERAKAFDGLPDGINPGHVLAAFKQAAPALGIAPRFVHAVDWLFGFTRPQDWQAPSRPIVWPSSELQMSRLQLERTAIKTLNRALAEFGLVVMQDSPTGKRYGRRDRVGRIVEAYGFDLSILAVRYDEFRAIADQMRAEHEARKALRRRIGAAAKRVRQCLSVARDRGLVWCELAEHEAAVECMLEEARGPVYSELTTDLEAIAEAIERRRDAVEKWLNSEVYSSYTDPKGGFIPTPHIPTNPYPIDNNTIVVEIRQVDNFAPAAPSSDKDIREVRGQEGQAPDRISAGELLGLSPRLAAHVPPGCRQPNFTHVVEAAYSLRHELGISPALWGRACTNTVMGRETAAIALAITAARPPGHIRGSAGGYFMGMVRKAETGKLDLQSSIAKLRHEHRLALVLGNRS